MTDGSLRYTLQEGKTGRGSGFSLAGPHRFQVGRDSLFPLIAPYLPFGGLFPRPPPDGLPVLLGPFGGVVLFSAMIWVFIPGFLMMN